MPYDRSVLRKPHVPPSGDLVEPGSRGAELSSYLTGLCHERRIAQEGEFDRCGL